MNRKERILCFSVIIIMIVPVSCKTAEFNFDVINISGMIYDFSNRPIAHCEVSLGKNYKCSTDINGRFTLPKVPVGTYTITGYKSDFECYSEEVIIRDAGQIIYIRMPSQNQLLNLVDEALTINNFNTAEDLAERAFQINKKNPEMLFYYAAIKFRQGEYEEAISFLEAARSFGSKDRYVDKFLTILKELKNAETVE